MTAPTTLTKELAPVVAMEVVQAMAKEVASVVAKEAAPAVWGSGMVRALAGMGGG